MKLILMSLLLTGLISCSAKKQNNMQEDGSAIELTDSDELLESSDDMALTDETLSEEPLTDSGLGDGSDMMAIEETAPLDDSSMAMEEPVAAEQPMKDEIVIDQVGSQMEYTVQNGDTLMMIAFKIYGDYARWREIANLNSSKLIRGQIAPTGTSLIYNAPAQPFTFNPEGSPYLVKNGDTLSGISIDTYGTMKFWKNIWDNNKPLIKNPNKIYAGFTIYTPAMEGRDVATE